MARADLEQLRDEIATLADELGGGLSGAEYQALQYWGEERLREELLLLESVREAQEEFEAEEEADEDRREILADLGYEELYYDDLYGWDVEVYGEYGEN